MRTFKRNKCDRYFNRLLKVKASFYVKRGVEVDQIIFGGNHFLYSTGNNNFPPEKIFLFNVVNKDVKKFLQNTPFIELPPKKPTQFYNLDYDENVGVITGTDLDHAFWRIAYIKGYISKRTYDFGIADDKAKVIRLATLGNLGKDEVYDKYENGILVGQNSTGGGGGPTGNTTALQFGVDAGNSFSFFSGSLCEGRITGAVLTDDWKVAEYNNQK